MAGIEGKLTISIRLLVIILIKYLRLFPATFPHLIKGLFVGEVLSRDEKKIFEKIVSDLLRSSAVVRSWQSDSRPYHGPFSFWFHLRLTGEFALVLVKSFGIIKVEDFVKGALIHDIMSDMGDTRKTRELAKELGLPEDVRHAIAAHMALFKKFPPISSMDWAMVMCDWYSHILDMILTVFYLIVHPSKILWFFKQLVWEGLLREFFMPRIKKH